MADFLTWDELLKCWGIEPSYLSFLLCLVEGGRVRPAKWDRSLPYPGWRWKTLEFEGWARSFNDVLFDLRDIELFEERFPERLPVGCCDSGTAAENQEERYPASQRHFWRCRAVARVLWVEDRSLSVTQIDESNEIALFGCEDRLAEHGTELVAEWITDVCREPYCPNEDEEWKLNETGVFETKPRMGAKQRHRSRCRAVASLTSLPTSLGFARSITVDCTDQHLSSLTFLLNDGEMLLLLSLRDAQKLPAEFFGIPIGL